MKIAIGSDHAGFKYKSIVIDYLSEEGHEVKDFGTCSEEEVDYPLYVRPVAKAVESGEFERGIVLGGSGNGEAIVANRIKGIRCALCWNEESALVARKHGDANMIAMGQRMISEELLIQIIKLWLKTPFEGGRHIQRIRLIDEEYSDEENETSEIQETQSDKDDFNVLISFGYILYSEGKNSFELKVDPGLKGPTVINIPSVSNWDSEVPEWALGRRDEIIGRIENRCKHMNFEFKEN